MAQTIRRLPGQLAGKEGVELLQRRACSVCNDSELGEVRLTQHELNLVSNLRGADWQARRSICAGRAVGAPVFWAYDDEHVSLLVGQDGTTPCVPGYAKDAGDGSAKDATDGQ